MNDPQLEGKGPFWIAMIGLAIFVILTLLLFIAVAPAISSWILTKEAGDLLIGKFQVVVGLPAAAVAAFVIVTFLQQTAGPIEFEGFGFKFRGAAGQVVLWIICFLVIVVAIKWLW